MSNCKLCLADCAFKGNDMKKGNCKGYIPMSNADRIRAMSDEELAWELMTWRLDAVARNHGVEGVYPDTQKEILKWLHQPAKEDT